MSNELDPFIKQQLNEILVQNFPDSIEGMSKDAKGERFKTVDILLTMYKDVLINIPVVKRAILEMFFTEKPQEISLLLNGFDYKINYYKSGAEENLIVEKVGVKKINLHKFNPFSGVQNSNISYSQIEPDETVVRNYNDLDISVDFAKKMLNEIKNVKI